MYRITRSLWLGPFASPERAPALAKAGITHLLNVGEAPSALRDDGGQFLEIAWHPIEDLQRIPDGTAESCLSILHRMVCAPGAVVYTHCVAGWNRSPTIIWLYLIACGIPAQLAKQVIEARARDAVPGHSKLVDDALIETVRLIGSRSFWPHPRPEALEPFE